MQINLINDFNAEVNRIYREGKAAGKTDEKIGKEVEEAASRKFYITARHRVSFRYSIKQKATWRAIWKRLLLHGERV